MCDEEQDYKVSDELLDRPLPVDSDDTERVRLRMRRRLVGRRLDRYLHGRFPHMSRTLIQRLIKQGGITVNGKTTKPSYEPNAGDIIEVLVPPPEPLELIPEPIPLDIVYEDDHMLALNKRTGIICHPAKSTQTGTIANGLAYYAQSLSHGDDPFRPGIVHRLDKNTTGIMLIAKTDEAHWRLGLQFERRTIHKTYMGIVEGEPQLDGDVIDAPLAAHERIKERYIVPGIRHRSFLFKEAVTRYQVVERFRGFTLVHMHPKTGRTHQLRVHMSHIGHPMFGDTYYGGHHFSEKDLTGSGSEEPLLLFQALHAFRIEFRHPITETMMELQAPPPAELQRVIDLLRAHRGK
ncbi:MAG: RluA family pseudouridine synthase [Phycisphaerae bacterium]|nr:RluA family pseudouridine synthase [Phycisphaerae bacterium]